MIVLLGRRSASESEQLKDWIALEIEVKKVLDQLIGWLEGRQLTSGRYLHRSFA